MSINNKFFFLTMLVSLFFVIDGSFVFPMQPVVAQVPVLQQPAPPNPALEHLINRIEEAYRIANETVHESNRSAALSNHANDAAINAMGRAHEASETSRRLLVLVDDVLARFGRIQEMPNRMEQLERDSMARMRDEAIRLRVSLEDAASYQNDLERENNIQLQTEEIRQKQRLGIFEQEARIHAQASVDTEKMKWDKIRQILTDPLCITKIVLAITAVAAGFYLAKHGIPMLIHYFTHPKVVSETSKASWFGWSDAQEPHELSELIFTPSLHNQLFDLVLRVQSAKMYNENLPNVLFYGAPGTGKTAFAKALAYYSGLNYALTSGSEFAKITDLNDANNELRKLLGWAQDDDNGLIVFIDEAESLFAHRRLPTTSKLTQDFINTFLALVPEKSQKNVMFIFATNHPFKLDDAITNRIGVTIEFTLPESSDREKILASYLSKYAQEHEAAVVQMHSEVMSELARYADLLEGLSPRAIKFVAEEMIIKARREENKELTVQIADAALEQAMHSLEQIAQWERERAKWVREGLL